MSHNDLIIMICILAIAELSYDATLSTNKQQNNETLQTYMQCIDLPDS